MLRCSGAVDAGGGRSFRRSPGLPKKNPGGVLGCIDTIRIYAAPSKYAAGRVNDGTGTFNATLNTAGSQTITATDTIAGSITGTSGNILVSPRYSAQLTSNTQAMDGDLKLQQGSMLSVGYDFTIPGQHPAANIGFTGAKVTFNNVTCTVGTPSATSFDVPMSSQPPYPDPLNSPAWYPSGDQNDPSTYQGSATLPTCSDPSGLVRLQQGGTFSTTVTSDVQVPKVNVRWHYKGQTGPAGGWSGTYSVTPS